MSGTSGDATSPRGAVGDGWTRPSDPSWGLPTRADRLLHRSPLQAVYRRRAAGRLAILGYHDVADPRIFARHMDLLRARFTPVGLEQAEDIILRRAPVPRHAVLVTFDDAERSVLEYALPAMRERGIPGIVFAIGGLIGADEPYWWREVADLVRAGGTTTLVPAGHPDEVVERLKGIPNGRRLEAIGQLRRTAARPASRYPQLTADELRTLHAGGISVANHTMTHPCLVRCDEAEALREIDLGAEAVAAITGARPRWLAYPNGDRDARVVAAAAAAGTRVALNYDNRLGRTPPPRPLEVSRLAVESYVSPERLELILSGLFSALMRGRDRAKAVLRRS